MTTLRLFVVFVPAWVLCQPAIAQYTVGDIVFVIKHEAAIIDNGRIVQKVKRGIALRVEVVNDEWLMVPSKPPGLIHQNDVLPADAAIAAFSRQITEDTKDAGAYAARALVRMHNNEFDAAIRDLNLAVRLDPSNAGAFTDRGKCWLEKAEFESAIRDFGAAARINPNDPTPCCLRASVWLEKSKYDNALADAAKALRVRPRFGLAFVCRGRAWSGKGKYDKALADFEEALKTDARDALAHCSIAWLRATCPEEEYRDGQKGIEHATKACEFTNWSNPADLDTLAAACAESGDFASAIEHETKAIELASEKRKAEFQSHLNLFKGGKPFRDELKK